MPAPLPRPKPAPTAAAPNLRTGAHDAGRVSSSPAAATGKREHGRAGSSSTDAPPMQALDFPWPEPPSPGSALELAPGVFWLRMPLPFALDHINLWLLAGDDGWTQVDSGYGDAATRALWERHFGSTLQARPISKLVVTHFHPDHLGNAGFLQSRFGCDVWMTLAEFLTAQAMHGQHSGYGIGLTGSLFAAHGMQPADVAALAARGNSYLHGVPELPGAIRRIAARDVLTLGNSRWRVIDGHGHSPEHASLYSEGLGVLISGDMLLPRISTNVSVWPIDADGDPLARFLDSIEAFRELPDDTLVLPSHGLPFRGIAARVAQLRTHHALRLAELEAAASHEVTAADVLPVLFRRPLDLQQRFFAMGEAIAHLNHLWHAGRLERRQCADGALRFSRPTPNASILK
jgi:glyoxylase-like metal-dependent hydrolase (beta-lactamase superfamily II)